MDMDACGAHRWVTAESNRRALIDMARDLEPFGIELLAIKGIYMVYELDVDAIRRPLQDADAIVARGSFDQAISVLTACGRWTPGSGWSSKAVSRKRGLGGTVDLHRTPLPLFFGAMRSAALHSRARRSEAFERRVFVPDAEDAACIALAHFVKDAVSVSRVVRTIDDLRQLGERADVTPQSVARRLGDHGLRLVGLVAFAALEREDKGWRYWSDHLAPSGGERWVANELVDVLRSQLAHHPDLAHLLVRSLADTGLRRAGGMSAAGLRLLRDRVLMLRARPGKQWFRVRSSTESAGRF